LKYLHKLIRLVRNVYIDLKTTGHFLGGTVATKHPHLGVTAIGSTDYSLMPALFGATLRADDVFVDVGCGKGRVLCWLVHKGYTNQLIGVELDPEISARTRLHLKKHSNISIISGNIFDNLPANATFFYLYNPFNEEIAKAFKQALESSYLPQGRTIRVLYYYSHCVKLFKDDPRWSIHEFSIGFQKEATLLTLNH